jgi:hypothetical protein
MMPIAIYRDFIDERTLFHFEKPHRFLTADEALALGLIDAEELAELQRKTQALGWEGNHETP